MRGPKRLLSVKKLGDRSIASTEVTRLNCRLGSFSLPGTAILGLLLAWQSPVLSQEAVRMSLAGEAAAQARHSAATAPGYYDLRCGSIGVSLSTGLDLEANDNIRFAPSDTQADLTLRPQVSTLLAWPVSNKNSVNLSLGAGYSAYVLHPEFNRFFIGPGSELSGDLYTGDLWINLHERLSVTENAYQDPTVIGTADYSQLQNVAGFIATWDLNKLILKSGYDHADYAAISGGAGLSDGCSDTGSLSAGYQLGPAISVGAESGAGLIQYSGHTAPVPRAINWNLGAFVEGQPTERVRLKAASGYTAYTPLSSSAQAAPSDFSGAYVNVSLNHQLNQFVEYALNGGRNVSFGFFAGTIDLSSAALTARWHLFQKLGLATWFQFEHGSQVLEGHGSFNRFGPGLSLDRPITRKMTGSLRYQYYQRGSDIPRGDYAVNILTLSLLVTL